MLNLEPSDWPRTVTWLWSANENSSISAPRKFTQKINLTLHEGKNAISSDGGDAILVDWPIQDEGLVARGHVPHLVEDSLTPSQVFLNLVLVEAAVLLKR